MENNRAYSVLITAGGTQEDIDTVRSITNRSTGRLGSAIADVFIQNGADVTYLCGETAALPKSRAAGVIKIRSVANLTETLDKLLREKMYDCVVHSMAVSDFSPRGVVSVDELAESIRRELSGGISGEGLRDLIINSVKPPAGKKISSGAADSLLLLRQTPKVIGRIKALQPQTLLVGFKLLSGVGDAELFDAGLELIAHSGSDYVLANDQSGISGDEHRAFLMNKTDILRRAATKADIARMVFECVAERLGGRA